MCPNLEDSQRSIGATNPGLANLKGEVTINAVSDRRNRRRENKFIPYVTEPKPQGSNGNDLPGLDANHSSGILKVSLNESSNTPTKSYAHRRRRDRGSSKPPGFIPGAPENPDLAGKFFSETHDNSNFNNGLLGPPQQEAVNFPKSNQFLIKNPRSDTE